MVLSHIILALMWIGYCFLHSLFAATAFKKKLQKRMGSQFKIYRLYYILFAMIPFAGIIIYQVCIPSMLIYKKILPIQIAGGLISGMGLIIMTICIRKYFLQVSGLRSLIENKTSNSLMITGIHRYVRHPLYLGTFLFLWGLWIMIPLWSLLICTIVITIYTLIGIGFEEKKLVNEFGQSYIEYQRSVPKIIPGSRSKVLSRQ